MSMNRQRPTIAESLQHDVMSLLFVVVGDCAQFLCVGIGLMNSSADEKRREFEDSRKASAGRLEMSQNRTEQLVHEEIRGDP